MNKTARIVRRMTVLCARNGCKMQLHNEDETTSEDHGKDEKLKKLNKKLFWKQ